MSIFSRKVKLPYRELSDFEKMKALLAHEQQQAVRAGKESFAEANDFECPDEPDPLERYFDTPTKHELAHIVSSRLPSVMEARIAKQKAVAAEEARLATTPAQSPSPPPAKQIAAQQGSVQPPSAAVGVSDSELGL